MSIIRRTIAGDFSYGYGKTDYLTQGNGVAQDVVTKLREWKYDWFADYERGIDWRDRLGNKNRKNLLDNDILDLVGQVENVTAITNFESTLDTSERLYTATINIMTPYGEEKIELITGGNN